MFLWSKAFQGLLLGGKVRSHVTGLYVAIHAPAWGCDVLGGYSRRIRIMIDIHTPRIGCGLAKWRCQTCCYPRTPHGVRLIEILQRGIDRLLLSAHPHGVRR